MKVSSVMDQDLQSRLQQQLREATLSNKKLETEIRELNRAKQDLAALRAADARFQIRDLQRLTNAVNDSYLQSQGVELGVEDYERGFTLFVLAFHRGLVELPPPLPREAPTPRDAPK